MLDGPAIFYLALPPGVFADAAETIAKAGLADETNGFRRLVIEKPFGTDLESALALNEQLHTVLARRPDLPHRPLPRQGDGAEHARVPVREPVHRAGAQLRRTSTRSRSPWRETLGVEGRSRYYDGIGALRDMVQNHLIQMMTFATMEPPALWDAEMIRDHKVEVLKSVRRVDPERRRGARPVHRGPRRGRAARSGTAPSPASIPTSRTDTFAAVRLHVDTWRWEGIPVLLRSGKRLAAKAHEVVFRFREPPTRLFRHTPLEHAEPNWLVFRMSPSECTELVVRTKQPGLELEARESVLRAEYADADDREASAYESLLLDVLEGDHTPFLRFDEVEWSWRIVDPILTAWKHGAPEDYVAGQRRPGRASTASSAPGHYWRPLVTPLN